MKYVMQEVLPNLVYSMLQFTFIFAQSVMYSIIAVALWLRDGELVDAVYPFSWYNMSLLSLTPPICLMVMRFDLIIQHMANQNLARN